MTNIGDPLDFEFEEPRSIYPAIAKKKKKVIGLGDLLADHYKEQRNLVERESKMAKFEKSCDFDEDMDVDAREAEFSKCVNKCQKEMGQISGDDEMPLWGIPVFGDQEKLFLKDYWHMGLLKLVFICGRVEKSIASWTFNLMLYSLKEVMRSRACEFWCAILLPEEEADLSSIEIDWLPNYAELKKALEIYGFQLDSLIKLSPDGQMVQLDVNSLRIVESISGVDAHSKHLRSAVAFQFLVTCLDKKIHDPEEILRLLIWINVKYQNCDLLKMYIYISLAENWLFCGSLLKDKGIHEIWGVCLKNCSCQITSSDLRSYASKVRSKASYLLQGTSSK